MNVRFEEYKSSPPRRVQRNSSKMIAWVVERKIVKNEQQAKWVLIGLCLVCVAVMVISLKSLSTSEGSGGNIEEMQKLYPELQM